MLPTLHLLPLPCPPLPHPSTSVEPSVAASTVASSMSQRLPFPAFPLRGSLPPLIPVLAAGPPAEYHSDSAESLEEIPVALARLGSAALASTSSSTSTATNIPPSSSQHALLLPSASVSSAQTTPSPQPRTKRRAGASRKQQAVATEQQRFDLAAAHTPSVFVTRGSGEPTPRPRHLPKMEDSTAVGKRKHNSKRSLEESRLPSSRTGTPLA